MAVLAPPPVRHSGLAGNSISSMPKVFQSSHPLKQQRPTLKRSIDESNYMETPSSPSKRSRVTFDADVEIVSADDEEELDPRVVKEQVRRAIQRHRFHDDDAFERIRTLFAVSPGKEGVRNAKNLRIHLQALLAHVSDLTKECSSLVHAIINSEWVGRDEAYFKLFVKFLGNLAAAQSGYIGKIMHMLVDLLSVQKTRRLLGSKVVFQRKIHRRVLQTIQYISQLLPTATGALAGRIAARLEDDFATPDHRMTYIRNFMELIKYVPELRLEILTSVLRQLIKLDITVQGDWDDLNENEEVEMLQYTSTSQTLAIVTGQDMARSNAVEDDHNYRDDDDEEVEGTEEDDLSTSDESDSEDDEDQDSLIVRRRKLKEDMKQMDMIMEILFQYYSQLTTSTMLQTRHDTIEQLIAQFHNLILPTYGLRHPQFLIFHFAQSDPIVIDRFVTSCVAILIDRTLPQALRHAAAAYVSGFVGRGSHVSPSVIQACIDLLCDELKMLQRLYEPSCRGPDLKRYGDFYSSFQALMYIFCFRWRDIGLSPSDVDGEFDIVEAESDQMQQYEFSESLRETLLATIYSPLNPLRVCTPIIVEQFAKTAMAVQLIYVYPKLEENKRVRLAPPRQKSALDTDIDHVTGDLNWVAEDGMLEAFFPYDPYHLPISKHWVENDYVDWQRLPGDFNDSDSDDDEDEDDDSDDAGVALDDDEMDSDSYEV